MADEPLKKTKVVRKKIDPERLRLSFNYDPETGLVTNAQRFNDTVRGLVGNGSKKKEYMRHDPSTSWEGMPAEVEGTKGRYNVKYEGMWIPAHCVAWALYHGEYPDFIIDHINRDPKDNRIANLRKATAGQNARNRTKAELKSSKFLGVCLFRGRWRAQITHSGHATFLGEFKSEEAAAIAYDAAAITMHREFANPNIIENPYLTEVKK